MSSKKSMRIEPTYRRVEWERPYFEAFLESNLMENNGGVELRCNPKWESRCIDTAPTDIWKYVAEISMPTLFIHSTGSTTFLPNVVQRIKKEVPHAVFARLQGGHNIIMERPAEVLSVVSGFLKKNNLL
jgi:pimeloyl-ACP methyl ester carboxylesterase